MGIDFIKEARERGLDAQTIEGQVIVQGHRSSGTLVLSRRPDSSVLISYTSFDNDFITSLFRGDSTRPIGKGEIAIYRGLYSEVQGEGMARYMMRLLELTKFDTMHSQSSHLE